MTLFERVFQEHAGCRSARRREGNGVGVWMPHNRWCPKFPCPPLSGKRIMTRAEGPPSGCQIESCDAGGLIAYAMAEEPVKINTKHYSQVGRAIRIFRSQEVDRM